MSLINKMLRQDAVYWAKTGDDIHGQPILGEPVALKVRWEETNEEFITANGTKDTSKVKVFVDVDVAPGGYLWLGLLVNVPSSLVPPDEAMEVRSFNKTGNLKQTWFLRMAFL